MTANWYYTMCFFMGVGIGYWAVFVTIGAEQFGTNIRATVTTTVPNFVRGSVPLITMLFMAFREFFALNVAALLTGVVCFGVAALALWRLQETFGKDLDYIEDEPVKL